MGLSHARKTWVLLWISPEDGVFQALMLTCSLYRPLLFGDQLFLEEPRVCAQVSLVGVGEHVVAGRRQKVCSVSADPPHPLGDLTFALVAS